MQSSSAFFFFEVCIAGLIGCTEYGFDAQAMEAGLASAETAKDNQTNSCANQQDCHSPATDPLCVEPGRYRVTDSVAEDTRPGGKRWERRTDKHANFSEAATYCEGLQLDGLVDWRLPAPSELNDLRYLPGGLFGGSNRHYCIPSLDQEAFPNTVAGPYWTSRSGPLDRAWYVGFDDGRSHWADASDIFAVRCVHD